MFDLRPKPVSHSNVPGVLLTIMRILPIISWFQDTPQTHIIPTVTDNQVWIYV